MASRRLRVPAHLEEVIRTLHPQTKRKIRAALTSVLAGQTMGDPLRDPLSGFQRLRIGRWRVVYRERQRLIEVFAIGPRATVYSELVARLDRRGDFSAPLTADEVSLLRWSEEHFGEVADRGEKD